MYKYVYEILQELSIHRPSSRQKSSRYFSTHDQNETAKTSLSPKDKQLKNYVLTKLNKIHAKKQILLAKKQKALLWYKMILDKMVSPLIEYMPDVTDSYHLSKLADFRTNEGFPETSVETNRKGIIIRPKCVEEPLPILIKPEYKVVKCRKKSWKIINKLTKARDSKNEMINKYKMWKNKVEKDPECQKKFGKKQGLLVYDLFLKDAIESKIEDLMPAINAKDEQSNVYDFRFQHEPELDQCENHLLKHVEVVASSNKLTTSNFNKGLNRSKTVTPKPLHTKTTNKTDTISVKTKPYDPSPLKKKDEKVQVLKLKPSIHSKEENQAKPPTERPQHRPNWVKSDNRMKLTKSEPAKDKAVIRKIDVPSKIKKPEVIQPASNNTLSVENRARNSAVCIRQNVDEKEAEKKVSNSNFTRAENFSEVLYEKSNDSGLLQDGIFKLSENILNETIIPDNKITENSDKYLLIEAKENIVNYPVGTYADICCGSKAESVVFESIGQSDTLSDFKSNIVVDKPNNDFGNPTSQGDVRFDQGRDVDQIESQTENKNTIFKNSTENVNTNLSECELMDAPKVTNSLVVPDKSAETETTTTSVSNILKNTYLVSFEVKDDEAYLKTRSQVVADEIKGDLIDLNIVLEEEKKERVGRKSETLLENPKRTSDDVSAPLNTSKSESQSQNKTYLPTFENKPKENMKINITSAINQKVLTEPVMNNLSKTKNMNSFKSQSAFQSHEKPQSFKGNSILDDKSGKNITDIIMKPKTLEPMKEHIDKDDKDPMKTEGTVSELNAKHKKPLSKSHSLELIGQEKKGKVLRHKKAVTEKEKNLLSSMPDKRIKVMNKTKELGKSEKYQEIINSVKKIIPSRNPNESILGKNTPKIVLTDNKIKNNVSMSKNYTKTINKLKEIISELPGSDNQQTIGATKYRHHRESENKNNKTSEKFLKTAEKENIVSKDDNLEIKETNIETNNNIKQETPKTVKVVGKIAKVKEELKPISVETIYIEASLTADKEKEDGKINLKPSVSNTSVHKNLMENNKLGSQIGQKERTEENSRNLSLKTNRTSLQTHQVLSNHSDKIAEPIPLKEVVFPERNLKPKSVSNIKSNERNSEGSQEPVRLNIVSKSMKSDEVEANQNITVLKNTPLKIRDKSIGDNTSNSPKDHSFAKSKGTERVKSAEIEVHRTSDNEKDSSTGNLRKSTDSKPTFFRVEKSRESSKIIKAKSDLNMNNIDTPKNKGPKRINIPPETNKSKGMQRDLSIIGTGKPLRIITSKVTVESRENKAKDQTNATLKEKDTHVSTVMNNNKTNSNDNEKFKFTMDKFVNDSKNPIVNQIKVTQYTPLGETVLKKNIKSENNLIKTDKKEIYSANTIKGKHSSVETMDKQIVESQKPAQTSPSVFQGKNKNTESKVKKETQPTGILTKKTLKATIISNEKPKRNVQTSNLTGDVNTLPENTVQSKIQVNSSDTMNKELLNLSKRLVNR